MNREEICSLYDTYNKLLPQSQKQAIYLYYFEDLSLREIADLLAQSRSAVQNALKKGIDKLKLIHNNING
jgi:RNA polymerase sigma factor (sigma-70 family)